MEIDSLFKVIHTAPVTPKQISDRHESAPKGGRTSSGRQRSKTLTEEVTAELGRFHDLLAALESLKTGVELHQQDDCSQLAKYVYCVKSLNQMLVLLGGNQPSSSLSSVVQPVGLKEHPPKYNLILSEINPALLVESRSSFGLEGEAGAVKTSFARIVTQAAIEKGLMCMYFPCSRIENKSQSLYEAIREYLISINATKEGQDFARLICGLDLVIIDGCDEAATFGTKKLATEIKALHHHASEHIEYEPKPGSEIFIPLDPRQCLRTSRISKTRNAIWLEEPLPDLDFDRLLDFEENQEFEPVITMAIKIITNQSPAAYCTQGCWK